MSKKYNIDNKGVITKAIKATSYGNCYHHTDCEVELIVANINSNTRFTKMRSEKFLTWKKKVTNATKIITSDCTYKRNSDKRIYLFL